jgi:YVTN family beta-propeller protein
MSTQLTRRQILSALLAATAVSCRQKTVAFTGYAVVVIGDSREVSVVDLSGFALSGKIAFPAVVSQIIYRAETDSLYVLCGAAGELHEYHWSSRTLKRTINLGQAADAMRLDPNQPALWVSLSNPHTMVEVPLEDFRVKARIGLPSAARSFDLSPYFSHLAASLEGGGVGVVSDLKNPEVKVVREQETFGPLRFRSDGRQVIAANHTEESLSFIRGVDGAPVVDLPIAMKARDLCFKPDGGQLFVTDGERDGVTLVYPYSTEVDRAILAGKSPGAMLACETPPYLFVANRLSSDVTILDLATGKLVAVVPVGNSPGFLAMTPDQQYVLALNEGTGDMAVIRLSSVRSRRNKTAPLFTMVPVGASPQSLIVIPA